jgi:hypothetical protein
VRRTLRPCSRATIALAPALCSTSLDFTYSRMSRAMGRSNIPLALNELSTPSTPEAQIAALQSLKNEIVGHEQRKELAVTHGVVKPLAGLLKAEARRGGKRRRSQANGHGSSLFSENRGSLAEWTTEDELRFQATLVVGTLANGEYTATAESYMEACRLICVSYRWTSICRPITCRQCPPSTARSIAPQRNTREACHDDRQNAEPDCRCGRAGETLGGHVGYIVKINTGSRGQRAHLHQARR